MAKIKTHYDSLNVARDAPASVIKAAYKVLCQTYHPDKYAGGPEEAVRIMKRINAAYAVLSDTNKRAEHDRWIEWQEEQQASHEARRIMHILNKSHAAPPAEYQEDPAFDFSTAIDKYRKIIGAHLDNLRIGCAKLNWKLWLAGVIGMVCVVALVYVVAPKPSVPVAPVNQEVVKTLKKARQLVKQGQAAKALALYMPLAGQGNAEAQFQVGLLYVNGGAGLAKDDKQAAEWIGKAAEQGHAEAQAKLGFMYATGKGVARNDYTAVYWCYKAAQQGDVAAQYNLGLMYAAGQGVAQDNSLAFTWYSKAAEQGHARAQYNLGHMYERGQGVAKDRKQAADWYRKAATLGLADAATALKQLEAKPD